MLETGDHAPEFQLADANGVCRDSRTLAGGGRALFVFYKASCPVCQLTSPFLDRLAHRSTLPVVFIAQDDPKVAARFNQQFGIFAAITLFDDKRYTVSNSFGIVSVPSIFLIEETGIIARAWAGFSREEMKALSEDAGQSIFTAEEMTRVPLYKPG